MDTSLLDNPAWHALNGRHAHLAQKRGPILRYPADVSPFIGFEQAEDSAILPDVLAEGETALIWWPEELATPAGLDLIVRFPILQMAAFDFQPVEIEAADVMGDDDVADMIALTALTKPGPFTTRTRHFGHYVGVREEGKLIAMAGERMKPGNFTEISAICTHPDYQGRGLAKRLTQIIGARIVKAGQTPFLNVLPENVSARALYDRLGFTLRRQMFVHLLRKPGGEAADDPFFSSL
ncbi:MAG: GNAT family N-acetyltransferase [Asticcacaulis sp.]|uniref:GNAT family N-acetyltransferase n=1 Tax=Asticcacaulis sp. TaxID=1872648 RepID=UPI003F7C6092